jgi:hypothetical protein
LIRDVALADEGSSASASSAAQAAQISLAERTPGILSPLEIFQRTVGTTPMAAVHY